MKRATEKKEVEDRAHSSASEIVVPVSLFQDRSVSVLESLVEYLKDILQLKYSEIGVLVNRDERTIWTCYSRAKKKRASAPLIVSFSNSIPLSIFEDRSVAVLEAITEYLKDTASLSYHDIAILLNRNDRTIWTCYSRAKKKREVKHG